MNNRVTTLRQESRPPNLRSVVIDHHKPDTGERWIAAAWGFIAGIAFCGVAIVVFWG